MNEKPFSIAPPWQPWSTLSHCTSSSSDSELSTPCLVKIAPSRPPVVLNAQHDPQCAWFLTGVTAPLATQSTESPAGPGGVGGVGGAGGVGGVAPQRPAGRF